MTSTWSHLTCPPQPPFPVRISDDVFLPLPSPSSALLRTSNSEPSLSFELKGLKVLAKEGDREKENVKVSDIKMRRRNTLLMTPGEVHKLGTLSFYPIHNHSTATATSTSLSFAIGDNDSSTSSSSSSNKRPMLPKTPQPIRRVSSEMTTPSSTSSSYHSGYNEDEEMNSEYDSCSSSFSTPYSSSIIKDSYDDNNNISKYNKPNLNSSPCPSQPSSKFLESSFSFILDNDNDHDRNKGTFGQNSKSRFKSKFKPTTTTNTMMTMNIDGLPNSSSSASNNELKFDFKFWRSPNKNNVNSKQFPSSPISSDNDDDEQHRIQNHNNAKRRKISRQIEWEGMPCPEELISPKTKQRVNDLGNGFSWASLH
ncbi:uncharacterized protein L201_001605 [Kwoniella dendrophila CBS 6074]|uniref:FHA domain-containing protein n=1 Tax=Kwoniella dendrophila CBS 6074 TaxID=1295534 RepID=A0AAX4JPH0_9TREE